MTAQRSRLHEAMAELLRRLRAFGRRIPLDLAVREAADEAQRALDALEEGGARA